MAELGKRLEGWEGWGGGGIALGNTMLLRFSLELDEFPMNYQNYPWGAIEYTNGERDEFNSVELDLQRCVPGLVVKVPQSSQYQFGPMKGNM